MTGSVPGLGQRHRDETRPSRGISTVFDVAICLLLVSATVLTVHGVAPATPDPAASAGSETAALLGTATATVSYSLPTDVRVGGAALTGSPSNEPASDRSTHDTVAGLLATAAMANLSVEDEQLTPLGDPFQSAVRNRTRPLLVGEEWRGQVVATWTPFTGSSLQGSVTFGDGPPPTVDVHTTVLTVPARFEGIDAGTRSNVSSFRELARTVATRVVSGLFPPEELAETLRGGTFETARTFVRYRQFAARFGVDLPSTPSAVTVDTANRRLVEALTTSFATELEETYDSPTAAASAVRVQQLSIVIRTWSP